MKKILFLLVVAGLIAFAWQIVSRLSADAIGMGLGVLLGVFAGVPVALLVMASGRRRNGREEAVGRRQQLHPYALPAPHAPQAPVIVLAGHGFGPQGAPAAQHPAYGAPDRPALPPPATAAEAQARQFKVVGETEEWIDEW